MRSQFLILLFSISLSLAAQDVKKDVLPEIVSIDGAKFYLHPIVKGNTLYSISKSYGITVDELKIANSNKWQELRIGDTLRVPLKAIEVLKEDQEQSDGNFLLHEVQKSNTLYSIAKEYNLEINEIIAANPEVETDGLKKGMKLKIPIAKLKSEPSLDEYIEPSTASPFITHRIMPKETLYSLSKTYSISIDSILKVNNGLQEGLKVNQLITIPILKEYQDSIEVNVKFDSAAIKPDYVVSLLLPFYLAEMQLAEDTTPNVSQRLYKQLYNKAQYGIDFYQGFKYAADSLKKEGLRLELRVFDTANDTSKVRKLIRDSSLAASDLIIGPLFYDEFVIAADFAKRKGIHIVSPVKQSNRILLGNSQVSKVISSDPVLFERLGTYLADSLSTHNLVFVYPDHIKERTQATLLKKSYFKQLETVKDTNVLRIPKEVVWDPKNYSLFKNKLDSSKRNIIIAPSDDQAFVTRLMTQLNQEDDYSITLIGTEEWKSYDNIEVDYLHNLDVHLVVSDFIDYNSKSVKDFEREYMKRCEMPPSKFSVLGYDVGMYYLKLMNEYGLNFELMLLGYQDEILSRKFEFFKTGIESGYENHSVYIIRYRDFQIQKVF